MSEAANLLTHYQGRSAGFTIKPFKGSSNKLEPLDSLDKQIQEPPVEWYNDTQPIHVRVEAVLYPIRQAILTPMKVTTNKLEKVLILS